MTRHSPLSDGAEIVFVTRRYCQPSGQCRFQCCKCPIVSRRIIPGRDGGELREGSTYTPPPSPQPADGGKNSFKLGPRPGPYHALITHTETRPALITVNRGDISHAGEHSRQTVLPSLHQGTGPFSLLLTSGSGHAEWLGGLL